MERELAQRRWEALLQSIAKPHPETADLAELTLVDWAEDVPTEDDLVELSACTPIRWVAGQGWVPE